MIMKGDTRKVDQSGPYLSSQNAATAIQEDHLEEYNPVIVRMNPGLHSKIGKRQLGGK